MSPPPLKVLCMDTNRDAATGLSALLRLSGHDARCAFDGGEGWRVARHFRPEVCVLDVGAVGAGGCDLAARVRWAFGRRVLLVAVGSGGCPDPRLAESDFDWLVRRPVTPEALLDVLGEFASGQPA